MPAHVRNSYPKQSHPGCRKYIVDNRLSPLLYSDQRSSLWYWDGLRARSDLENAPEWVDMTITQRKEMRRLMATGFYGSVVQNAIIDYQHVWAIRDQVGHDPAALEWRPPFPL